VVWGGLAVDLQDPVQRKQAIPAARQEENIDWYKMCGFLCGLAVHLQHHMQRTQAVPAHSRSGVTNV
jgi:hypothetical protein